MTDPAPIGRLIGVVPDPVRREVAVSGQTSTKSDRLDLLLSRNGQQIAAIEVKVLSDLGLDQLTRYTSAFPQAQRRFVLHLSSLPVNADFPPGWDELSWEDVLSAYAESDHPWVGSYSPGIGGPAGPPGALSGRRHRLE
ncbi:PD-(D/E)XK nuclease family protein [Flexivirga sp.]|uniref:PD-(D/E)XK nuclease family protein n=1 Tax=Flexivirga sp. TaxID=1962927 RepID=UPI0039C8A401